MILRYKTYDIVLTLLRKLIAILVRPLVEIVCFNPYMIVFTNRYNLLPSIHSIDTRIQ